MCWWWVLAAGFTQQLRCTEGCYGSVIRAQDGSVPACSWEAESCGCGCRWSSWAAKRAAWGVPYRQGDTERPTRFFNVGQCRAM